MTFVAQRNSARRRIQPAGRGCHRKIIETLALPDDVTLSVDIDPVNLG
jgi:hypothetical protein